MKNKADTQDRGRDATGEVFIVQVSDSHSKLAQVPPPWRYFGEQQQPACLSPGAAWTIPDFHSKQQLGKVCQEALHSVRASKNAPELCENETGVCP